MRVQLAEIPLDRDRFLRSLVRELSGALEDIVGLRDASGYISVVGQAIGSQIDRDYRAALATPRLTREQVAAVCVDLKRRIKGDFRVVEEDDERIETIARGDGRCRVVVHLTPGPAAEAVEGREYFRSGG